MAREKEIKVETPDEWSLKSEREFLGEQIHTDKRSSAWRNVDDELPPAGNQLLLCTDGHTPALCTYDGEDFWEYPLDNKFRPTHWMQIPTITNNQ